MSDVHDEIKQARNRLQVERHNNAAVAAGVETVLNARAKEIDALEAAIERHGRAAGHIAELRRIVKAQIVNFKSTDEVIYLPDSRLGWTPGWREDLAAHHKRHGIKTASTEREREIDA
jgi:hypothetical protein